MYRLSLNNLRLSILYYLLRKIQPVTQRKRTWTSKRNRLGLLFSKNANVWRKWKSLSMEIPLVRIQIQRIWAQAMVSNLKPQRKLALKINYTIVVWTRSARLFKLEFLWTKALTKNAHCQCRQQIKGQVKNILNFIKSNIKVIRSKPVNMKRL